MNLMLKAFGQSEDLILRDRALKVMDLHLKLSNLLEIYTWRIFKKKYELFDIRNTEKAFELIYWKIKSGLNSKVANPIHYKETDYCKYTSSCWIEQVFPNDFRIEFSLGAHGYYGYPPMMVGINPIKDNTKFPIDKLNDIARLFIREWKPEFLCVTDRDYFHKVSKASEHDLAWTGGYTFLSKGLLERRPMKVLQKLFNPKFDVISEIEKNGFDIENINDLGYLIWVTKEVFDGNNSEHVSKALRLEKIFLKNDIKISYP